MTEKQKATLRQYLLDFALSWRHMVSSPIPEIQLIGRDGVDRSADLIWSFCQGMGDTQVIQISSVDLGGQNIPAGVMAGYLAKALIWAERGRFLSFHTRFKTEQEHRVLHGIIVDGKVYRLKYLVDLMRSGGTPQDVDKWESTPIPSDTDAYRPVRGRNSCVLYSFHTPVRFGDEYTITAKRNPNTTAEDPEDRQDPGLRLERDERSQVVTLFSPDRRRMERQHRQEKADRFQELCAVLEWLGHTPTKTERNDAKYIEKPGDGCRSIHAAEITKVTLGGVTLTWEIAA